VVFPSSPERQLESALTKVSMIDEMTAQLYERVRIKPQNRLLIEAVDGPGGPAKMAIDADVCVVLIPGLLYKQFPETGADGTALRDIADAMAIPFLTIPLDGTEGLEASAATIGEWLQFRVPPAKAIVLVSLSKGSAEVMHAIARCDSRPAFQRVIAWISVSGLPLGTPSMELIMRNPLRRAFLSAYCLLRGWKLGPIREVLAHRPWQAGMLPPHMMLIQVVAFPLREHLKDRPSRRLHRQLARFGPSDGYALLEELARLPGYLYPVWGADHYLRGMDELPARLAKVLAFVLETARRSSNTTWIHSHNERVDP
jgi:hypothetical protein